MFARRMTSPIFEDTGNFINVKNVKLRFRSSRKQYFVSTLDEQYH
jgi:hypothetical protein